MNIRTAIKSALATLVTIVAASLPASAQGGAQAFVIDTPAIRHELSRAQCQKLVDHFVADEEAIAHFSDWNQEHGCWVCIAKLGEHLFIGPDLELWEYPKHCRRLGGDSWTCADKSRILATAEDGSKHCLRFSVEATEATQHRPRPHQPPKPTEPH